MLEKFWTENFDNQHATIYKFPPYPQNQALFFESTPCFSSNIPIKPPPNIKIRRTQKTIVTVKQSDRLGNQMYEYISFWAKAKNKGPVFYIPSCLIRELEEISRNLPVLPMSYFAYCPLQEYPVAVTVDKLDHSNRNIILRNYIPLPTYIAT